jgi:hypothetical protein
MIRNTFITSDGIKEKFAIDTLKILAPAVAIAIALAGAPARAASTHTHSGPQSGQSVELARSGTEMPQKKKGGKKAKKAKSKKKDSLPS